MNDHLMSVGEQDSWCDQRENWRLQTGGKGRLVDTRKEKEGGMCRVAPGGKSQDPVTAGGRGEGDP